MSDEPMLTPERVFRYILTLLAGIGLGAAVVFVSIWWAVK